MGLFYSSLESPQLLPDLIVLIASNCDYQTQLNVWRTCKKLRDHPKMKEYVRVAKYEIMRETIFDVSCNINVLPAWRYKILMYINHQGDHGEIYHKSTHAFVFSPYQYLDVIRPDVTIDILDNTVMISGNIKVKKILWQKGRWWLSGYDYVFELQY
jgi:hypothetical protein